MISAALRRRASELGVQLTYEDVDHVVHDADPAVVEQVVEVLAAAEAGAGPGVVAPVHVMAGTTENRVPIAARATDAALLVDGRREAVTVLDGAIELPAGLPVGCHPLHVEAGPNIAECLVVVPPPLMPGADPSVRSSSLFAPAYALWDVDEPLPSFTNLGRLARHLPSAGVDLLATLPLYAAFLDEPFDPSPYSPVSRLHWNEVYLADAGLPAEPLPEFARQAGGNVDWRAAGERRRRQLVRAAADAGDALLAELDRFTAAHPDVGSYARFRAEREAGGDGVVERSHVLAQYLADRELAAIADDGAAADLSLDLPIGSHPDGWETWAHPDLFASTIAVGAPPDTFFTEGQNWGFPPQLPAAMRHSGYGLWRQMIARAGRHASMLRVDHVMAVHRLWWIPDGQPADRGVYVHYPHDELLAVIAAEAARADLAVVGENLGTVPPAVDEALDRWAMLGMYEEQFAMDGSSLGDIPARSVSGVRTHDMAPFAVASEPHATRRGGRYRRLLGAPDGPLLDVVLARLAASDAQVVVADLDDLLDENRPHNLPGRVVPGIWQRRLDEPLAATLANPRVTRRLRLLERSSR